MGMDYMEEAITGLRESESVANVEILGEDTLYVTRTDGMPDRIYRIDPVTGEQTITDLKEDDTGGTRVYELSNGTMRQVG